MSSERWGIGLAEAVSIAELEREYGGAADGGVKGRVVRRLIAAEHAAREDDLAVVTSARWAEAASASSAAVLCAPEVAARCPEGRRWVHPHAMYVVARLIAEPEPPPGIDALATVAPGAVVDPTARIGARAVVHAGARIGAKSVIGEGAIIYGRVHVGDRVVVGPLAVVGHPGFGWATGPRSELVRVPQRGGVIVEDDVEIGALATVDAGTLGPTVLSRGVKLDAHVHVGHNASVGEGTLVAAQSGFAGSARIGPRVLVGGQVGVTDHAVVGEGARIAAKSGVIGDVAAGAVVAGFPAVPRTSWLRAWAKVLGRRRK